MNKLSIPIFVIAIIVAGICVAFAQPPQSPCGDGVCDDFEKVNPNLCPQDCKETDAGSVIKSIKVPFPIEPFESHGDLWFSTWADDDTVFVSWGDGFGLNLSTRPLYSHHGLAKLRGMFPKVTAEVVKQFMPLSDEVNNSKPSSLLFYNKRLYAAIHSPLMEPNMGFIAYSDDYGKTFNYDSNIPWTKEKNSKFISLMFINMGKNYELNIDGYVYAFGIGSEAFWNGPIYLARVPKDKILDYSAWTYFSGFGQNSEVKWSNEQFDAASLNSLITKHLFSSIYHPGIKRYIILMASDIKGELYEAPNPWGPWAFAGTWFQGANSEWISSYMPGIITKDIDDNSFYFAVAGTELGKDHGPDDKKYRFRLGKITMETKNN